MITAAFLIVAALAFAAALIKAASALRKNRPPGQGLPFTVMLTISVSCLLLSDKVQIREDRLYPDLGRLLSNITTMIAAFAILALLITLGSSPSEARRNLTRHLVVFIVSIAVMVVLFAMASPLAETLGDFGGLYRSRPELAGYIAIFIAFLGTALAELLILTWRYARLARHRRYLHAGLLLMAAGSAIGLVYLAEKTIYVITQIANLPPPSASDQRCTSLISRPVRVLHHAADHRGPARRHRRHPAGLGRRAGGPLAYLTDKLGGTEPIPRGSEIPALPPRHRDRRRPAPAAPLPRSGRHRSGPASRHRPGPARRPAPRHDPGHRTCRRPRRTHCRTRLSRSARRRVR